jgi:hypothetical protein
MDMDFARQQSDKHSHAVRDTDETTEGTVFSMLSVMRIHS